MPVLGRLKTQVLYVAGYLARFVAACPGWGQTYPTSAYREKALDWLGLLLGLLIDYSDQAQLWDLFIRLLINSSLISTIIYSFIECSISVSWLIPWIYLFQFLRCDIPLNVIPHSEHDNSFNCFSLKTVLWLMLRKSVRPWFARASGTGAFRESGVSLLDKFALCWRSLSVSHLCPSTN